MRHEGEGYYRYTVLRPQRLMATPPHPHDAAVQKGGFSPLFRKSWPHRSSLVTEESRGKLLKFTLGLFLVVHFFLLFFFFC